MPRSVLSRLALCLSLAFLVACGQAPSSTVQSSVCWIAHAGGGFVPLDQDVPNLETCGARLEVRYLRQRRPVTGSYGGMYVYVDASSIEAAAPNGPKAILIDPGNRRLVDADIGQLLKTRPLTETERITAANADFNLDEMRRRPPPPEPAAPPPTPRSPGP